MSSIELFIAIGNLNCGILLRTANYILIRCLVSLKSWFALCHGDDSMHMLSVFFCPSSQMDFESCWPHALNGTMSAEKNFEIAVDIMVVNHPENEPTAKVQYIIMATRCAFLFSLYSMCTWIKQA